MQIKELFSNYLHVITPKFSYEETSEMGYRADFEILLKGIFESINVKRIDHDARAKDGSKPDFIVLNQDVPILYIEAKTIGVDLDKVEKSEQMKRYFGYANLVLTDYVEFRFYRNGVRYGEAIKIAETDIKGRTLKPLTENAELLAKTLIDFTQSHKEPIRSGGHLAKIMGGKAQRIRDNLKRFFQRENEQNGEIVRVYETLKQMLVHDLSLEDFADMYAQTLVYGLFVARYYDETPETFSRQEARDLVPASNPFLQHFFDHIAGANFDKRLSYIVDELCTVFAHSDTKKLIEEYMGDADPVIHFYEDFLKEYDAELRKKMGAYYTPLPVVRFIIRAVDQILEKDFNLPNGLADTSKLPSGQHRVQILDPAVGTGTFISATIASIYARLKNQGQEGRWPAYVHNDLLPRLHGFELMMAPYTIAHLKLSLAFKQTGFWKFHKRLGIYLTNSLEQSDNQTDILSFGLANSIAEEAKAADRIKTEAPVMVVVGNPPYSVSSSNKGKWILDLIKDYKKDLNERNIQPLSDDYIKFIRYAEHFIEKNGSGIVAMITNNSFLDGIIHRQMRKHLLETFDDIYVLNLHGNSNKKEKALDGSKDENVFDIKQGVTISIFVRKAGLKESLGRVKYAELYGEKTSKFKELNGSHLEEMKWSELDPCAPNYFFVSKDFSMIEEYEYGFKLDSLFPINTSGIKTHNDEKLISFDQFQEDNYPILYRPFDLRWIEYNLKKVVRPRYSVMKHMLQNNMCMSSSKNVEYGPYRHFFVSKILMQLHTVCLKETDYIFPLYLYAEDGTRTPNFNPEIVAKIEAITGAVEPEDIFDYIYAVLHSPSYREKYKEFLKIDFPRVPYPKDLAHFKELVELGRELRGLHLLESPKVSQFITTYPVAGEDTVEQIAYKDGNVFINKEQYFGKVPEVAWNFYIGGYQPAQKWLKDRKGRTLTNLDIEHYQKIIVSLVETDRIMKEIDKIAL